jgi:primosomal protein N' (replication factor Y)
MNGSFSHTLIDELKITLARKEQAILFQNRRGYAPAMQCTTCGWTQDCVQCDVALTYHLHFNALRCHYCGYQTKLPKDCPACGNAKFTTKGFGTEKVEEELQILLPDAKIARMDVDTVRGKYAHAQLIEQFENKEIDILVGTQMVTKGLDFEAVRLVGVLSADQLLHFPDFRASERAFQLITQVAGRAGRSEVRGTVLIQALDSEHPVIGEVLKHRFTQHYEREIAERWKFFYPPYYRLIHLELRHKDRATVQDAAKWFADTLKITLDTSVIGPAEPGIAWLRGLYLMQIMVKLERSATNLTEAKRLILDTTQELARSKGFTTVQVAVNVDPY